MSKVERDVNARLDSSAMRARIDAWVPVNSGTRNLRGLETMAQLLGNALSPLPGELRLIAPAGVEAVNASGQVELIEHGDHLLLSVRPDAERRMMFFGHMDTVYAADHAFQAMTMREDGALVGPGVTDMKGGLSVLVEALLALEAQQAIDDLGYDVLINSDEETGSLSSAGLIADVAHGKIAAFGYEPALPDGTLAGARGGTGNFALVVRGRSAHAGRNPEEGRNAIVAAAGLAIALAAEAGPLLSINPARIDGGAPNNVVPDLAVLRVNFRPRSRTAIEAARSALDRIAADIAAAHDVVVEVHGVFNRPPKPIDPAAERLFALVEAAGRDLGMRLERHDTGGVCDGNNVAAAGVPVVDTMGVRGGAIHSADEYLLLDSLHERAALSAMAVLRIAREFR